MAFKFVIIPLLVFPLSLSAQVYRCDGPGGPIYSQLPCAQDAELVIIHDPVMQKQLKNAADDGQVIHQEPVKSRADSMESFVKTLHKQRQQQLAEIDASISRLKDQLEAPDEQEQPSEPVRKHINAEVDSLQSTRLAINTQYDSLIAEAERRTRPVHTVN